ncbi:hypothetical protein BYT27DRAFT_6938510 [Phlegmacium glaucopus]|nr:hypothetical protein BYT27DRAFT_6938510 [Phlegmacium glaucopus]
MLKKQDVKHVASMRLGSDVPGLETETQERVENVSSQSKRMKFKMYCYPVLPMRLKPVYYIAISAPAT